MPLFKGNTTKDYCQEVWSKGLDTCLSVPSVQMKARAEPQGSESAGSRCGDREGCQLPASLGTAVPAQ